MKINSLRLFAAFVVCALRSNAASLTYQPSPYKGTDLWVTNYYSYNDDYGVNDDRLRVGGWGDWYSSAIKFDLEGLPANPTQVALFLWMRSSDEGSTPVSMNAYALTNDWNEDSGWYVPKWMGYSLGQVQAPSLGRFNGIGLLSLYRQWKSGSLQNKGIYLSATANNNRFNTFYSSDHIIPYYRPYLYIEYNETVTPPNFKLPLPGGRRWVVTTEIGGLDHQHPSKYFPNGEEDHLYRDPYHTNDFSPGNYYSIDFGSSSLPAYSGDIPVYAAASGKVFQAGGGLDHPNGYFVVIDHDGDGDINTGYSTRYLHLKYQPVVVAQQVLAQGQMIGYMGNTGRDADGSPTSHGTHLHFGVRYRNQGHSSVNELTFVKLEGMILKQYQTEITSDTLREWEPAKRVRSANSYYWSSNTN